MHRTTFFDITKSLLVSVLLLGLISNSHAALTLINRETFQGIETLDSITPGNLGTVDSAAHFNKRAVGPKITDDFTAQGKGWSADFQMTSATSKNGRHTYSLSGASATAGFVSAFYYVDTLVASGSNPGIFQSTIVSNGNPLLKICWNPANGAFQYLRNGVWTYADTNQFVPIRQWFELRQQWVTNGADCLSLSCDYRLAGSSHWTSLYTIASPFNMGAPLSEVRTGLLNQTGSDSFFRGRYGMPSLYSMDSWTDRLNSLSDVSDPVATANNWYVDPVNGNDSNDGLSPSTAWSTVGKVNAESQNCGMFPTTGGYMHGDTLIIDTTVANWQLDGSYLNILTRGLNVIQLGGGLTGAGEIQAWTRIDNASFTPTVGTTNVYQTTDTSKSAVIWENDKWMNHPTGPNFSAVRSSLENTPGSFWTDGTTLYLHPFDDTNPMTDGKVYTRSYYRSGSNSAVLVQAPDTRLSGLRVRKTCIADKLTNDPGSNYCFQGQGTFGGNNLFEYCYGDYGSKHIFGFTDNDTARQTTVNNCQAEQATPYSSQTPWVDYSPESKNGTATTVYNNCVTNSGTGLIGSTQGNLLSTAGWYCHNNGSANYQFAQITFNNCNINGSFGTAGAVNTVRINQGRIGGGLFQSPDTLISGTQIIGRAPSCGLAGGTTRVRNCLISPESIANGNGSLLLQGTLDYQSNTIDCRQTTSNGDLAALFVRYGPLSLIWKNNYFIGNDSIDFVILQNGVNTDNYTFSNNAYSLGPKSKILQNFNDGATTADRTFSEWQALGKDSNSFTTTAAVSIGSDYQPISNSPLINSGINLGAVPDFSGILFSSRNDIGAYESLTPLESWRYQYFGTIANEGSAADNASPASDGIPNLIKYAVGLSPLVPGTLPLQSDGISGYLRLTLSKNPQATDVTYFVEVTDNLVSGPWTTAGTTTEINTTTTLQVRDNAPFASAPRRFMRLRISQP